MIPIWRELHAAFAIELRVEAMEWFVLRGRKIAARWGARDAASQARQIGLG